jgi:hypothetical protein
MNTDELELDIYEYLQEKYEWELTDDIDEEAVLEDLRFAFSKVDVDIRNVKWYPQARKFQVLYFPVPDPVRLTVEV